MNLNAKTDSFTWIQLGETKIHIGRMLIPWRDLGILTCLNNSLDIKQVLNLEQLIELYTYVAVHNYCRGNVKVMIQVWKNIQIAKTFTDEDGLRIGPRKDYTSEWIKKVAWLLLEGKEVFWFIDSTHKVRFYKQSHFILALVSNPKKFLGVHGVWINLPAMLSEYAGIRFQKKRNDDGIMMQFRKIYKSLTGWIPWVGKFINPGTEKVMHIIRQPNSESIIHTNNFWDVTSIEHRRPKE